ncbi:glycosyltransferase family 2 protein [Bacteroidota bacterium]
MTKVAVVILNWNGIHFIKEFLPTLIKHTKLEGVEIIVADNNSTDNSIEHLKEHHPEVRLIEMDENHGFAGGYNKALEKIDSRYYLLLNSDIEVNANWLEPLVSFLDKNKEFAACSPMLLDYYNKSRYEYAGGAGGYIDKFGYTFCRGRIFNSSEEANLSMTKALEVFWTTGACMLIRSELFNAAGGFDPFFFAHMEEVDLCWRLKNMGHKLACVPESKIYHVGGGTLPKSNPFKTYLNFRNNLLLLYKNLPENKLNRIVFIRMIMDGLSAFLFLLSFKFKDIAAIFRAHFNFRKKKKDYKQFRAIQLEKYGFPDHNEIYKQSVVIDYFIAGNRTFSKLRNNFGTRMDTKTI